MHSSTRFALFWAVVAACATGAQAADGDQVAPFFGFMGAMSAVVFACMGAAYGTAKAGVGIASMGVMRPELVMKSIVPVVMAGVLGIYGLIMAVIISTNSASPRDPPNPYFPLAKTPRVDFGRPVPPTFSSPREPRAPRVLSARTSRVLSRPSHVEVRALLAPSDPRHAPHRDSQFTPRDTPCSRGTRTSPPVCPAGSRVSPRAWPSASRATPACARTRNSLSCSRVSCSFSSSPRPWRCTG